MTSAYHAQHSPSILKRHHPLVLAVAFDFPPPRIALTFRTPVLGHQRFEFHIDLGFPLANDPSDCIGIHTLVVQRVLLLILFAVEDL